MTRRLPLRAPHKSAVEAAWSKTGESKGRSTTRSTVTARQQLPRTAGLDARALRLGGRDDQKVAVARWQAHRMLKALSMALRNTINICTQASIYCSQPALAQRHIATTASAASQR